MSSPLKAVRKYSAKALNFVGDKAKVAVAHFQDDLHKSMVKAMDHTNRPPKEKHVRRILQASGGKGIEPKELVTEIGNTITKSMDWLVANKGLQVIHRCIQEGHENFTEAILRVSASKVLNFSSFKDQSSANGLEHTPFVRQYALFLEERIVLYRDFGLRVLSPKLTIQAMIPKDSKSAMVDLFKAIENLQRVMEELLMCCNKFKKTMLHNRSTIGAFTLLLFDSFGLYKMLSDGSLRLLDLYFDLNPKQAKQGFELYQKHCQQSERLIGVYDLAKNTDGINNNLIPSLAPQPESLLQTMREFLEGSTSNNKSNFAAMTKEVAKATTTAYAQSENSKDSLYAFTDDVETSNLSDFLSEEEMNKIKIEDNEQQQPPADALPVKIARNRTGSAAPTPQIQAPKQQKSSIDDLFQFTEAAPKQQPSTKQQGNDMFDFTSTAQPVAPVADKKLNADDLFSFQQPKVNTDNPFDLSQQKRNPYAQPQPNPYGNPYAQPQPNPYGNPYGQPQPNPYGNPYAQPQPNPYGNPYAQPQHQQFHQQPAPQKKSDNPFDF